MAIVMLCSKLADITVSGCLNRGGVAYEAGVRALIGYSSVRMYSYLSVMLSDHLTSYHSS